jgi:peptidyl-prolyl cis-trans isomerase D
MFDFVRTHSRLMLGLMVLLIFPSFVFFGIQGYSRYTEGGNADVAKVDGIAITKGEWDQAHQRSVDRVRGRMSGVDVKLFDTPEMRRETLDGLVRERTLLAAANRLHLVPGDERLQQQFVNDPQFASIRNPDGSVNRDLLAAQGMSSELFAQQLRQQLSVQQVQFGIAGTAVAPKASVAAGFDALLQRREIQLQRFDAKDFRDKVNPTDADLETFFKANEAQFRAPEQAQIEYVVLDLDSLKKGLTVPEEDLKRFYAENASRYTAAEERRASHILVKAEKGISGAERDKAKAKAEALLAEVRKAPGTFADVARKSSDDPGSAPRGGDLDFFGRGGMVKPFEDAVYAMKQGEISNLIETDFGFHIIQLTGARGGEKKTFEAVRAEIDNEVRKQMAQKRYAEAAEQFTNTVYEQADSLQPAIDKLKLDKKTATVQRTPAEGTLGALASVKLLDALFGNDALRNKRNTDAVEIGPNQLAAARVLSYTPARTLPLVEVKDRVRERVLASQALALARKEGAQRLAEVKAAPATALPETLTVSRAQVQGLPRSAVDAVLRADAAKLPTALGIETDTGYLVARLTQVLPRDAVPGGDTAMQGQYAQAWAAAESQAYYESLKKRLKVEIKVAAPAAVAASGAAK